jgi:hypothetical protein
MRHYCTYFDHNYLPRGLALYRSLRRYSPDFKLWVLCLSPQAHSALQALALPGIETISLQELERRDPALAQAKSNRSTIEYYFTCTPSLPGFIFRNWDGVDCISYVDSDMYFFSDPEAIFDEIGSCSVAITPHRFSPAMQWKEKFGRFNVGWLTFRRDSAGLACLESWRTQCIEWCYDRYEDGRYADQKYLDEWPVRFQGVKVLEHPGINTAPWNVGGCRLSQGPHGVSVNDQPLILFHFHKLKQVTPRIYDPQWHDYAIKPTAILRRQIYGPYIEVLERCKAMAAPVIGKDVMGTMRPSGGGRKLSPARRVWRSSPLRRWWYGSRAMAAVLRGRNLLVRRSRPGSP